MFFLFQRRSCRTEFTWSKEEDARVQWEMDESLNGRMMVVESLNGRMIGWMDGRRHDATKMQSLMYRLRFFGGGHSQEGANQRHFEGTSKASLRHF